MSTVANRALQSEAAYHSRLGESVRRTLSGSPPRNPVEAALEQILRDVRQRAAHGDAEALSTAWASDAPPWL